MRWQWAGISRRLEALWWSNMVDSRSLEKDACKELTKSNKKCARRYKGRPKSKTKSNKEQKPTSCVSLLPVGYGGMVRKTYVCGTASIFWCPWLISAGMWPWFAQLDVAVPGPSRGSSRSAMNPQKWLGQGSWASADIVQTHLSQ